MTIVVYNGTNSIGKTVRQITATMTDNTAAIVSLSLKVEGCDCMRLAGDWGYYSSLV